MMILINAFSIALFVGEYVYSYGQMEHSNKFPSNHAHSRQFLETSSKQENREKEPFIWSNLSKPKFGKSIPRNITALKGTNAFLECVVYDIGNKTVSWIREDDLHILTVNQYAYTADDRFEVIHKPESNNWILKIKSAQPRDSGRYDCQVNTHPTDPITFPVWLRVFVPKVTILGPRERFVDRGSTINFTCIIEHYLQSNGNSFWYHNNKKISYDSTESLVSVITDRGPLTKTILLIHDASEAASGTYSCVPSAFTLSSVKIHILNGETPAAIATSSCSTLFTTCIILKSSTLCIVMSLCIVQLLLNGFLLM